MDSLHAAQTLVSPRFFKIFKGFKALLQFYDMSRCQSGAPAAAATGSSRPAAAALRLLHRRRRQSAAPRQRICQRERRTACHHRSHFRVSTLHCSNCQRTHFNTHAAPALTKHFHGTYRQKKPCLKNINNTQYITTSRQIRGKKEFKKSPGSAFLETSCITTSKNPSSKNQTSSILGI